MKRVVHGVIDTFAEPGLFSRLRAYNQPASFYNYA